MTGRELDGTEITGRANLADIPAVRTYTCEACGAAGTEPTHSMYCEHLSAARIWASDAAVSLRKALVTLQLVRNAIINARDDMDDAEFSALLGQQAAAMGRVDGGARALLGEIDREAGAR